MEEDFNKPFTIKIGIFNQDDRIAKEVNEYFSLIVNNIKKYKKFKISNSAINLDFDDIGNFNVIIFSITEKNRIDYKLKLDKINKVLSKMNSEAVAIILTCDMIFYDRDSENYDERFIKLKKEILSNINDNDFELSYYSIEFKKALKSINDLNYSFDDYFNATESESIKLLFNLYELESFCIDKKKPGKIVFRILNNTGIINFIEELCETLKFYKQKKMVLENFKIGFNKLNINNVGDLCKEYENIDFLKDRELSELQSNINNIMMKKLTDFINRNKNSDDEFRYYLSLNKMDKQFDKCKIVTHIKVELDRIKSNINMNIDNINIININHLFSIIDFYENDIDKIRLLFFKIYEKPKLFIENIRNNTEWSTFIDKCMNLEIKKTFENKESGDNKFVDLIIDFFIGFIFKKIDVHCSSTSNNTNSNSIDINNLYPFALKTLLSDYSHLFPIKKLDMYLFRHNRFLLNNNIDNLIIKLDKKDFDELLKLEYKFISLLN